MQVIPAPSAFSLAASRLGWPIQEIRLVSLHGRPLDLIRPHLQPRGRIIALTSDEHGPAALAALLTGAGFGKSVFIVLESLGGKKERLTRHLAETFTLPDVSRLNVCAIEVVGGRKARVLPLANGLDDGLFEHDGQITKREIRAITLSALSPRQGELLWDIGAGAGSISIEWMLADPAMRAIAVESNQDRAARIRRNAENFGVPSLVVVEGEAPTVLDGLEAPDCIFIGGGGSEPFVIETALEALKPGGRIVANAVTVEMEIILLGLHTQLGGHLIRLDVSRAAPVGTMTGWRPSMPVTQWAWTKPAEEQE
jgi:precorrin-6Y C5,15-methyltransferase (decarboxylating)